MKSVWWALVKPEPRAKKQLNGQDPTGIYFQAIQALGAFFPFFARFHRLAEAVPTSLGLAVRSIACSARPWHRMR